MALKAHYTLSEARRLTGYKTTHMVHYLARQGIVRPTVRGSRGRGNKRLYSYSDLIILRAFRRLLDRGLSVSKLRRAQDQFAKLYRDAELGSVPAKYLMTDGQRVIYEDDAGRLVDLTEEGQLAFAFVVDLEQINNELHDEIKKMA